VIPVSQSDICEFLGDLFHGHAVTRNTLIAVARSRGARPAVVDVVRKLRHPAYRQCCDLMADVADLPAVFDPWEAARAPAASRPQHPP
jgi:hypothetical protein